MFFKFLDFLFKGKPKKEEVHERGGSVIPLERIVLRLLDKAERAVINGDQEGADQFLEQANNIYTTSFRGKGFYPPRLINRIDEITAIYEKAYLADDSSEDSPPYSG